ncbi:MAG: hypothetical protein WB987_12850 [Candidatus Acidiferrales bacterium]
MPEPPSMFAAETHSPPVPNYLSRYIQPTFGHGLRIWWAFFWRTTLITMILTFVLNFGLKVIYEHSNIPGRLIRLILTVSPFLISYGIALFVMEYILRKKFRDFRIGLLSNSGDEGAQMLAPTFVRVTRVWWTYSWRTLVYRLIILVAATIPLTVIVGVFTRLPIMQVLMRTLVTTAIDAAAGLFVIYSNILDEDFSDFRVCLLPLQRDQVASASPAATPAST